MDSRVVRAGTGRGSDEGEMYLGEADKVWIVHNNGITTIQLDRPQS